MPSNLTDDSETRDDADEGDDETLPVERLCLDFSQRGTYQERFLEFLTKNSEVLALEAKTPEAAAQAWIDRVWPNTVPGAAIFANTRPHHEYLIRPPAHGPLSATYAAGTLAPAFYAQQTTNGLRIVDFAVMPHVPPRHYERLVTGVVYTRFRDPLRFPLPLFGERLQPIMSSRDLHALLRLPRHREATERRLRLWQEYLTWKRKLIEQDQVALRYRAWTFKDQRLQFSLRDQPARALVNRELMAMDVQDSHGEDVWKPKSKSPKGPSAGEVRRSEAAGEGWQLTLEPDEDLRKRLTDAEEKERAKLLPKEGFLLSAIAGDLGPIKNQSTGIDRLLNGRSFAPQLSAYLFDIADALTPDPAKPLPDLPPHERLNPRLNEDQLRAVRGGLAAPDLYLIQGPPGTGKTTVIAELCFQIARAGGRVLVASQTNLAVDNALARLGNRPELRPLRLIDEKRVRDVDNEFLESNVVDRWFRGIGTHCEARWQHSEKLVETLARARLALGELQQQVWGADKQAEKHRDFTEQRSQRAHLHEEALRACAALQAEIREGENIDTALDQVAQWLRGRSGPPVAELLLGSAQAQRLLDAAAALPAAEPPFAGSPPQPSGVSTERRLTAALDALEEARHLPKRLGALIQALEPVLRACRDAQSPAPEASQRELQDLLQRRAVLAESEDDRDLQALKQVNRRIKELRDSGWSALCRTLEQDARELWPEPALPTSVDQVVSSLKPEPRFVAQLNELRASAARMQRRQTGLPTELAQLAAYAAAEREQRRAAASARKHALAAAEQQAASLHQAVAQLGPQIEEAARALHTHAERWREAWARATPDLTEQTPPPPLSAQALAARQTQLGAWLQAQQPQLLRHQRWNQIQTDWLARIRKTSDADREHLRQLYIQHCNVLGATCNEVGKWQHYDTPGFRPYDVVIVDEVSKATPPELILPMLLGRKTVLVGDHRQLPPMLRERESSYSEAIESGELSADDFRRFERMVTACLFEELFNAAPDALRASLWTQYRMHPHVMSAVNAFYDGNLQPGPDEKTLDRMRQHHLTVLDANGGKLLEPHQHVLWVDSSFDAHGHPALESQDGTSKFNQTEVAATEQLLHALDAALRDRGYGPRRPGEDIAGPAEAGLTVQAWLGKCLPVARPETIADLFERGAVWLNGRPARGETEVKREDQLRFDPQKPVGVISFYGQQLKRLRQARDRYKSALAQRGQEPVLDIRMDTVDRFQGMERSIVLVSLVRSVPRLSGGDFVRDFRRINVALSRAQELLVVLGASNTFAQAVVELPAPGPGQAPRRERVYERIFAHAAHVGGRRAIKDLPPAGRAAASDRGPQDAPPAGFRGPQPRRTGRRTP